MTTFVYEGTEVRKTGRTAIRKLPGRPGSTAKELLIVEITPVSEFDWKKWVSPEQLYEVQPSKNTQ